MAKSQETFGKKEKEAKRAKKRQDKLLKQQERKSNSTDGSLDSMMAYVDEYGRIVDAPPIETKRKEIDASTIELGVPKREEENLSAERKGKIEFFNDSKGYGFIKDLNSQEKFFVHVHGLLNPVKENDIVTFELERGMKGMNAVRVKLSSL